jgi:hypothetical protein
MGHKIRHPGASRKKLLVLKISEQEEPPKPAGLMINFE